MQSYFHDISERNREKFNKSCIIIFTVTSMLVAMFFLFNVFFITGGSYSVKLMEWTYASSEKISEIRDNDRFWMEADENNPVKIQEGGPYVILVGKLPVSDTYDTLAIKTANSTISVSVDDEIVYNTLRKKPLLAGSNVSIVDVKKGVETRDIEIILYAPLAFDVDVYLTNNEYASVSAAAIPYFDIILAVIFIAISFLAFLLTKKSAGRAKRKLSLCLLAAGVLSGISVIVNPIYTGIYISDAVVLFKLGAFINVLVPGLILLLVLVERLKWNPIIEGVIGINVLYAVCIFCSPYDILTVALMKLCTIIQVMNMVIFFYMVNKYKLKISALNFSVYLCYAAASILHWYGIANQLRFDFRLPMLFAGVMFVVVSFITIAIEARDPLRVLQSVETDVKKTTSKRAKTVFVDDDINMMQGYANGGNIKILPKSDEEIMAKKDGILCFPSVTDVFEFHGVLAHIVSEKCDGESHHLLHVAEYVRIICMHMGMSEERAMFVSKASLLHDIGKICIPHSILLKTEILSETEYNLIRSHNIHGYNILNSENDRFFKMAAQIAREHHENYNGTGYLGLKGEEINLYARIVTVADVFDAVTSARAYKEAWSFEEGVKYIEKQKYDFFDPDVASVFVSCQDEIYEIYRAFEVNARLYGV